jgi:Sulfotransferase family
MTPAGPADGDRIELASWLAPGLLALLAWTEPGPESGEWQLLVESGADTVQAVAGWLRCASAEAERTRQPCIVTVSMAPRLAEAQLRGIVVRAGDERRAFAPESLEKVMCEPPELGAACRTRFDAETRERVQGFLAATPARHRIDLTAQLAANLAALRDSLREQLPTTKFEPGPHAGRLEDVTALEESGFWLTGWVHDAAPKQVQFTAVSPEGIRHELPAGAVIFHPRPAYAETLEDDATFTTKGYHAFVELEHPSRHPDGWVMEFRGAGGRASEHRAHSPVSQDTGELRQLLLTQLRNDPHNEAAFEHLVLPARTRLRVDRHEATIDHVVSFGQVPQAPELSVVVAVRRIDRIDHQLLSFARDPDFEGAELIFVVSRADRDERVVDLAEGLHDLHELPFAVAIASGPVARQRALDLGASLARGSLLVLMGGEVFPSVPGWIAKMREVLEGSPGVGAVGPKLLYEDDSIAHAGIAYVRRSTGRWRRSLPFAGLSRRTPEANSRRQVQAVSDACMMVDRQLFHRCGGFSELYLQTGDEAGDLCLRLADTAEVWYVPDAELHLIDEDPPVKLSRGGDSFNEWLFDHRCGTRLDASAPYDAGDAPPLVTERLPPIPGFGSRRSVAPIEILEVMKPTLDREVVLDASFSLPSNEIGSAYTNTYTLAIAGWAVAADGGPLAIEVSDGADVVWRATADRRRPDVGATFPDRPDAAESGFEFVVSSLSLKVEFELAIDAVSAGGARASLGRLRGRRRPLRSGYRPRLQPLLITTLGRSGSAWLTGLLSLHHELLALSPFRFEAKLTSYWMEMLHTLAEPASYIQTILPEISDPEWWIGSRQTPVPVHLRDSGMPRWLACENVEILAGFCQSRFDGFYHELAGLQKRPQARLFVEKCYPGPVPRAIAELYPDCRELVLVRDVRDMVCSIDDYNARRGFKLWGREKAQTDEEWFHHLRGEAGKLLESWRTRQDRAHLVRYEDLIADPERTLTEILSYAGVSAGADIVAQMFEQDTRQAPEEKRFHQTSGSAEASLGRWKRDLSPERQALCAEAFDDILEGFGYEPTNALTTGAAVSDDDRAATTAS